MCGICGFRQTGTGAGAETGGGGDAPERMQEVVARMRARLRHRGPDDAGEWLDPACGLALGHTRLAVLDPSPAGRQPMVSPCGRYVICYNGEVYNHLELRRELECHGHTFQGHSDTATILAAFAQWGIFPALRRFNGMFAIALWDSRERRLHLMRDRIGKKPLYYGWQGGGFLFGSELKALREHPQFRGEIDRNALAAYLRFNYVPAPHSIYKGIFKLPAGCVLTVGADMPRDFSPSPQTDTAEAGPGDGTSPRRYWALAEVFAQGQREPYRGGFAQAREELGEILGAAVERRTLSDVPLGAFLSGGIDSSLIVALLRQRSAGAIKTFTIGMPHAALDEASHARAVARHLGTEHTELYITPQEALAVVPLLPEIYDEPFADSSQIPTFLVSRLARQQVTVALSGDGGDELFGGYRRYLETARWQRLARWPHWARGVLAGLLELTDKSGGLEFIRKCAPALLPGILRGGESAGESARKIARAIRANTGADFYRGMVSQCQKPSLLLAGGEEAAIGFERLPCANEGEGIVRRMMLWDLLGYHSDDILVKLDRASMACSLEARAPLLDPQVVEFAAALPQDYLVQGGRGKLLLRALLADFLPPELTERPKAGFSVPLGGWLRGPLRDWAEALLTRPRLEAEGFFRAGAVRAEWARALAGGAEAATVCWGVLMFQAWLAKNGAPHKSA